MQKKRLSTKVLSAVLSLLMILTVIPLVPLAPTADAATTEYYYPAGTKFIKDVAIIYYKSSDEGWTQISNAVGAGSGLGMAMPGDLTQGTGGDYYIYMGWTWTTDPTEAVTGFRLEWNGDRPNSRTQDGVTWYPINSGVHAWVPQLHSDGRVLLNTGVKGDWGRDKGDSIEVYITKDPAFGPPLTDLYRANVEDDSAGMNDKVNQGYTFVRSFQSAETLDVNKGAGGRTLYLMYKAYTGLQKVDTTNLRNAYANTASFIGSSNYTSASLSALSLARNEAYVIMNAFDNNKGYAQYTQAQIDAATKKINDAANALETYLYLNGTTNGGTADQTITVKIGRNSTATVDLSKYTATKPGSDFVGWAQRSTATQGETGTVTVGFNEMYYALFGTELTLSFNYLDKDGNIITTQKSAYAMNNKKTASVTKDNPRAKVTLGDRDFAFIGWREDTTATGEGLVEKDGLYTISVDEPNVVLYAIYSADITFTQDVNKGSPEIEPQIQTQYLNINSEITKSKHEFTVSSDEPVRDGGTFLGWADSKTANTVQYSAGHKFLLEDNLTIYAAYDMMKWEVEFIGDNGEIIDKQTISHGDDAVYPEAIPTKGYDTEYHYEFANWDKTAEEITNVKNDITVSAVFTAIDHEYTITENYAPDCLNDGEDHYACNCGYEKDVAVDALGHDEILNPGHEATCTMDGATDERTCARCLIVLQKKEILPALGHNYELSEGKEATCSVGGYEIWVCTNNNNHKETRNITMPTGIHVENTNKGWSATCLENGRTESTDCIHCGAVISEYSIILAEGHKLVTGEDEKYIAPTCEEKGRTQGKHCSVCNVVIVETEEIPALGHDWADFVAKPATCTEAGYTAGTKCRYCHEVKDSVEIPALNHGENGYTVIVHEATCTEDGYTEYICDYDTKHNYKENGEAATGHEGGTATCKDKAICTKCGEAYGNTIAHSYDSVVFPATCTKKGYTEFTCTVCGDSYQGDETPLAAHKYDDGKITTAPTCCDAGVKTFTCINCTEASYTEAVAATGHTVTDWTVEGTEATGSCDDCGETITANPEDVGLELPECERCGMVHKYNSGLFKYKGIYCSIIYFFRQIVNFFKGNA